MSRYIGPKLKITKKLGYLPGLTTKQNISSNQLAKNDILKENGQKKFTEYAIRLKEKQKLKFNYGLTENQLFRYVQEARRRQGASGLILLQLLEMRLDNVCFSLGLAKTIAEARQMVNHGHIEVNKKLVDIPSYSCSINDIIAVKKNSKLRVLVKDNVKQKSNFSMPSNLNFDKLKLEACILDFPKRNELLFELNELLVIEYYSNK